MSDSLTGGAGSVWVLVLVGIGVACAGLALIAGNVELGPLAVPHSPVLGAIGVVAGLLFVTAAALRAARRRSQH